MNWWLRSPYCNSNNGATNALNVNTNGNWNNNNCSNSYGIRPALMESETSSPQKGRKRYTIIKGGRILSEACAWADDKHITPRQAALRGAQLATLEKGAGVRLDWPELLLQTRPVTI